MKVRFSKLKQNPSFFLFSFFLTVFLRIWKKGTKNSGRKRWERQEVDGQQKKRNLVSPPLKHTSKFFQLWETHSFFYFWANCLIEDFENWKFLATFATQKFLFQLCSAYAEKFWKNKLGAKRRKSRERLVQAM